MNDAELNVNLKLNAEQAKQDAQKAGEQIANSAGGIFKKTVDPAQLEAQRKLISQLGEASVRAANREAKIKMDSHVGLYRYMEREDNKRTQKNLRYMRLTESMVKNYSMLTGAVLNPLGGLTMMFAARQVFSARRAQAERTRQRGGVGESITASAFMTGGLVGAAAAAGFALKGFTVAVDSTKEAIQNAGRIYSKSITSGFGLKTTVQRDLIAKILGVDEKDLFRMGAQYSYLGEKLKFSTKVISETNPELTKLNWDFGILKANLLALGSAIGSELASGITKVIELANRLAKYATESIIDKPKERMFEDKLQQSGRSINDFKFFQSLANVGIGGGASGYNKFAALKQLSQMNSSTFFETTKAAGIQHKEAMQLRLLAQEFKKFTPPQKKSEIPPPVSFMKQLPASTWERMGLVVGGGGGVNYQAETFKQTKRMADILTSMYRGYKDMGAVSSLGGFPLPALP